jgi:tetratricopeptide (TPR) repeat protein
MLWLVVAQMATTSVQAQAPRDSSRAVLERAVIEADWNSVERTASQWRVASQTTSGRNDAWLHYDLAYALHRRASALIIDDKASQAEAMLTEAVAAAARAHELGGGAQAQALEGALTGQLAGAKGGFSMMRLGRRSFALLDAAVKAAPDDPRVALLNGITRLNAPAFVGGGAVRGEAELRRATRLYANDRSTSPEPEWGHADAHIWLAIALHKQDKLPDARAELARALELAPGHRWIVQSLQPAFSR